MSALGSDPPQSACVIFLGVLDIQSAAGLLQCVVAVVVVGREGGGGVMSAQCSDLCVYVCVMRHRSLSLGELLCHRAPMHRRTSAVHKVAVRRGCRSACE